MTSSNNSTGYSSRFSGKLSGILTDEEGELERRGRFRAREAYRNLVRATDDFEPIGTLGDAELANEQDVYEHPDLNLEAHGIPLGNLPDGGREVSFDGPGLFVTYGAPGQGKLSRVIARLLIQMTEPGGFDRSVVFNDVAEEIETSLGNRIQDKLIHAPARPGVRKAGTVRFNPLSVAAKFHGTPVFQAVVDEQALAIQPPTPGGGENSWVGEDGRAFVLSPIMQHSIDLLGDEATLGWVYDRLFGGARKLRDLFREMSLSPNGSVANAGSFLMSWQDDGEREFGIVMRETLRHLRMFEPGSFLRLASSASDFDPADLKQQVGHLFYQMPPSVLGATGRYSALFFHSVMRGYAEATEGKTRCHFVIDEAGNISRMPFLREAIRLLRKYGVSVHLLFQSRKAAAQVYTEDGRIDFEELAAVLQVLGTDDPGLLRDFSLWSGTTTIETISTTAQSGAVESVSHALQEQARPLLQTENLRGLASHECLVKVPGAPLFLLENPHWFTVPSLRGRLDSPRDLPGMV